MATPTNPQAGPQFINQKTLKELATLLVKDAGLHEGNFDLSLEIQIAVGSLGPTPEQALPGALFGVKSIGLTRTEKPNVNTVDASIVNPRSAAIDQRSNVMQRTIAAGKAAAKKAPSR